MNGDVSGWALQVASEQLGYFSLSDVPEERLGDVYLLAEEIDN